MYRKTIAEVVKSAEEDCEEERKAALELAIANFDGEDEVQRRFGHGSFGSHEATDRLYVQTEMLEWFILGSPTVALVPEAYAMAHLAYELLGAAYQKVSAYSSDLHPRMNSHEHEDL